MNQHEQVFVQLTRGTFGSAPSTVASRAKDEFKVKSISCINQLLRTAFAWVTFRERLRDTEVRLLVPPLSHQQFPLGRNIDLELYPCRWQVALYFK
jgi:hypothetical protein